MSFVIGFAGAIVVLALLVIGVVAGWHLRGWDDRRQVHAAEQHMDEAELRKLAAEQRAYDALQNYTAEQAYGLRGDE